MDVLGLSLLAATAFVLLALGSVEKALHARTLASFVIRVHVNGTRGKSSVTRLIAAGLRAGGVRTCAKTTGTLPRLIHPDGVEEPIYRASRPNVIEQLAVLRRARKLRADAIVIECMALQPFLQWVSAASLVQPTHGVITNVRADHLDVMGPDESAVAAALAGSIPVGRPTYTSETRSLKVLADACRDRQSELVVVRLAESPVTEAELARFRYVEHADNVALALKVCADLGVKRRTALAGMHACRPDPGALTIEQLRVAGRVLCFVNGFAANDPESTGQVWELALARAARAGPRVALINCRLDRADRSAQLGAACVTWTPADAYLLTGSGTHFFLHEAERAGLARERVQVLENESASQVAERLVALAGLDGVVVGLGNIGGMGLQLLDLLRGSGAPERQAAGTRSRAG